MPANIDASDFDLRANLSTYNQRLRWARKRARLTQDQVCALVGMSQGAYSLLEKRGMESGKTASLAAVLRVSAIWLETGVGEPELPDDPSKAFVEVRVVELKLVPGSPSFSVDLRAGVEAEPIMFRKSWLDVKGYRPERLFATAVKGQSMEPTLFEADLVVFNTHDVEPVDGHVYAINFEGEAVIRRLTRDRGQWWIDSDSPDKARFPRKAYTPSSSVIGRVILKQSERI